MKMTTVLTVVVTALTCFAISAAAGLAFTHTTGGRHVTLNLGDRVSLPVIGWGCEYSVQQPGASFSCDPGVPGTASQGQPIFATLQGKLNVTSFQRPQFTRLPLPHGKSLYVYSFSVVRP